MRKLLLAGVVFAGISRATIAYVNSTKCAAASTCATTWSASIGNRLIVMYALNNPQVGTTPTDNTTPSSSTYTNLVSKTDFNAQTLIYVSSPLTSGGTITVTNPGGSSKFIVVAEFSGLTATLDQTAQTASASGGGTGTCPSATNLSIATSNAADLLISAYSSYNTSNACGSITPSSGTVVQSNCTTAGNQDFSFAYQIVGSTSTYTQQFAFVQTFNSDGSSCGFVALKASAPIIPHRAFIQ